MNTLVLFELPPRFADELNGFSARKFLTVVIDITHYLTHQWRPLPTVTHALALWVLLNKTEQLAEIFTVDLPADWRKALEDSLYDDLDWRHLQTGTAMDFASWFTSFDPPQWLTAFTATWAR